MSLKDKCDYGFHSCVCWTKTAALICKGSKFIHGRALNGFHANLSWVSVTELQGHLLYFIQLIECNMFISGFHQHTFSPSAVTLSCSLPKQTNMAKGEKRMFIVRRRPWKPFSRFSLLILSHLFIPNSSLYQTL